MWTHALLQLCLLLNTLSTVVVVWSFQFDGHAGRRMPPSRSRRDGRCDTSPQSRYRTPRPLLSIGSSLITKAVTKDVASSAATTLTESLNEAATVNPLLADAVICGGGPAGLLTAIMLAQQQQQQQAKDDTDGSSSLQPRFKTIHVYDRLSEPPSPDDDLVWFTDVARFYLIGLGGRGQRALRIFGLWDEVEQRCTAVLGRKDWTPESTEPVERIFGSERRTTTQVLPRDKLVGVLHQHIQKHYANQITLHYGVEVQPIDFGSSSTSSAASQTGHEADTALIRVAKCESAETTARVNPTELLSYQATSSSNNEEMVVCDTDVSYVSTPLLIAADGAGRTIANAVATVERNEQSRIANPLARWWTKAWGQPAMRIQRYPDDNQRIYKTIPVKLPSDWRGDLNYSARTKRVNFDALPANSKGDYCGVLLLKSDDPMATANTNPDELRSMLDDALPQFSTLLDDATVAAVAKKPVSFLPAFRYVSRLHHGTTTVLVGDSAHQVKPYFGLGCNSALEDVVVLSECLKAHPTNVGLAILSYSRQRSPESKTLVQISRDLDRPGKLGFVMFVLPIILDSIFSKLFPKLFLPNVITMLQNENYTFQRLARRKRLDRALQVTMLSAVVGGLGAAAKLSVHALASVLRLRPRTIWAGMLGLAIAMSGVKSVLARIQPTK